LSKKVRKGIVSGTQVQQVLNEITIADQHYNDDSAVTIATSTDITKLSTRLNKQESYNKMLYKYIKDIYSHLRKIEEEMKKNGAGSTATSGTNSS
jgi:hypothetical protein